MRIRSAGVVFVTALLLSGCGSGGSSGSTPAEAVVHLQFASTTPAAAAPASRSAYRKATAPAPAIVDFDLGDIPSTTKFFFLIQNTGNRDATNVALTTNNPNVIVRPAIISVVHPVKDGGITPLIQVEILHGFGPNGLGEHAILDPGSLPFTVMAASDQDTTSATMDANILVANYTINSPSGALLDTAVTSGSIFPIGEDGTISELYYQSAVEYVDLLPHTDIELGVDTVISASESKLSVTNNGNCPIRVISRTDVYTRSGIGPIVEIPVGQTLTIPCWTVYLGTITDIHTAVEIRAGALFSPILHTPYRTGAQMIDASIQFFIAPPG